MSNSQKPVTVRLTIDFPAEQHTYLKMLAAKKGISMRRYVIESLCGKQQEEKHMNVTENKFRNSLNKVLEENDEVLRRLAKK